MPADTRDKLLDIALTLFAERGFDGVSIAGIAAELGLSKQALLHHFATKEQLYAELLARISNDFERRVAELDDGNGDDESIGRLFVELAADSLEHRRQTTLLMRELLDNRERAERAGRWYLRQFVDLLVDRIHRLPSWQHGSREQAAAAAYQLLGAVNYFAVSGSTLRGMWGEEHYDAMHCAFAGQLHRTVLATLRAGPALAPGGD